MPNKLRLGVVCYATDTGLGIQTRLLHKFLKPAKTMLVDIHALNHMTVHDEWYTNVDMRTNGFPTDKEVDDFLDGLDVVFACETPLNFYLFGKANQLGIATILQANPEFFDYFSRPILPHPSVVALPSLWMEERIKQAVPDTKVTHLPVPIDPDYLPKRTITQARNFFHVAGRPAVSDRNGTLDFIAAIKILNRPSDVRFTIYCQAPTPQLSAAIAGTSIRLVEHIPNYADIYAEGDVMVLPRRYGGLCLPLNEAIGSGIPVLMPDIEPNNLWLPPEWRVPVMPRRQTLMTRTAIDVHSVNVKALADRMSQLYRSPELVVRMHGQAQELAEGLRWSTLEARYEEVIAEAIKRIGVKV